MLSKENEGQFINLFSGQYGRSLGPRPLAWEYSDGISLKSKVAEITGKDDIPSGNLFSLARYLNEPLQRGVFKAFFSFAGYNNPRDLALFFTTLNNTPWFKPGEEVEMDKVQNSLDDFARRSGLKPAPVLILHNGYDFLKVQRDNLERPHPVRLTVPGLIGQYDWNPGFTAIPGILRGRPAPGPELVLPRISNLLKDCIDGPYEKGFKESRVEYGSHSDYLFGFLNLINEHSFYHAIFIANKELLNGIGRDADPYGPLFKGVYDQGLIFFPPTPRTDNRPVVLIPKADSLRFFKPDPQNPLGLTRYTERRMS